MPFLAAFGAAAMASVSAITVVGLAQAAAVVSAGTGILSKITGSKTLGKISMGFGIASGVGFAGAGIASLASSAGAAEGALAGNIGSKGLLATDSMSSALKAPLKGSAAAASEGLSTFNPKTGGLTSADSFASNSNKIGGGIKALGSFDPELEKSFFDRANGTLTKYNGVLNLAGGMGQAYMQNEQMQLQKDLLDKKLGFDQQLVDRVAVNNGTPSNFNPNLNLSRDPNGFGLLRR